MSIKVQIYKRMQVAKQHHGTEVYRVIDKGDGVSSNHWSWNSRVLFPRKMTE